MADRPLPHPYLVLAAALLLPGCGQVLNRQPVRGLIYLFFIILFGTLTFLSAGPGVSLVGRLAGGIFIYALSIPDAYRTARLRWEIRRRGAGPQQGSA
jgi:TM2 domain-containing membrane protein YozV